MTFEEFKQACDVQINEKGKETEVTCTFLDILVQTFDTPSARKAPDYVTDKTLLNFYNYLKKEFGDG